MLNFSQVKDSLYLTMIPSSVIIRASDTYSRTYHELDTTQEGFTTMTHTLTEATPTPLEERVARLRADLFSSPPGRQTLLELTPAGMVQTNPDVMDFCDWQQFSQWPQSY
jgi:hypothetical protein